MAAWIHPQTESSPSQPVRASAEAGGRTIAAGEFKARCLKLLDEVAQSRSSLVITKFGRPVARLVPIEEPRQLFGALRETAAVEQDLISPIGVDWEAALD